MTTPGDTENKNQRKVLTIKGKDSGRSTLTVQAKTPQKVSTYNGSTVIVINKKKQEEDKLGSLTTAEKNSRN